MLSSKFPVVLYHYDASPFSTKVKNILALKRIAHKRVDVPMTLPRPDLSRLGVTYRRIPVLAIGNDIYCDSSLIASALERRFPSSKGYGTIFPPRKGGATDTGLIKAFAMYYADRVLFPLAAQNLPYKKFTPEFVQDRSAWLGTPIDNDKMAARQPEVKSSISSHMGLLEEQLADGREWLMDTELPSLADVSVQFVYAWLQQFRSVKEVFDPAKFPQTIRWISQLSEYLDTPQANAAYEKITGEEAAVLISSSQSEDHCIVGFDDIEAGRLGVELHDYVAVTPTDNGKVPTEGRLVALNREEVVIQTKSLTGKVIHCHFPRLNFSVKAGGVAKL
ncbi:hypothetical protein A0H81_03728 [Grifola frondosa]|uniref:GST N-terminal domain-containing protein n=1 Tax=Grifola frondosa TaxID=5627 RepID=A0A1C7MJ24_GRIFR|nr:hypothetical protein A0H81_03728 [Grifola frondosa]